MNIGEQEYVAVLDNILTALEKNGVGQREQEELLMIAYSLRGREFFTSDGSMSR